MHKASSLQAKLMTHCQTTPGQEGGAWARERLRAILPGGAESTWAHIPMDFQPLNLNPDGISLAPCLVTPLKLHFTFLSSRQLLSLS